MLKGMLKRYLKREEGATIIEYAIVAPILFIMVLGIIEFSLLMYAQSVLDSATTQSARFGTTNGEYVGESVNPDGITGREEFVVANIKRRVGGLLSSAEPPLFINRSSFGSSDGPALYDVSYRWEFFTPFIGEFFSSSPCGAAGSSGEVGVYNICSSAFVTNEDF